MPRRAKGPRLYYKERAGRPPFWEIRDGSTYLTTGTDSRREAEEALARYIDQKHRPSGPARPEDLSISVVLAIYAEEHAPHVADPARIGYAIDALDAFWGDLTVSAIKSATCRRYARSRVNKDGSKTAQGTIRRELGCLRAALEYCRREGYLVSAPPVTLPDKPPAKDRWLTRDEVACLIRGARALGPKGRHLQHFIHHAVYTGSRKATILAMHIDTPSLSGGHVDTVNGILYRRPQGKAGTKKQQNPARLPPRYLAQVRRQARNGRLYIVQDHNGHRVGSIKTGWKHAVKLAKELAAKRGIEIDLTGVTPHTLKHTAITWAMQRGAKPWDAAGYFSTSIATIEAVYAHHSPEHQQSAVEAMDRRA